MEQEPVELSFAEEVTHFVEEVTHFVEGVFAKLLASPRNLQNYLFSSILLEENSRLQYLLVVVLASQDFEVD